jgi:hypothetical protein
MKAIVIITALLCGPAQADDTWKETTARLIEQWGDALETCRNPDIDEKAQASGCESNLAIEEQLNKLGCHIAISTTWWCGISPLSSQ